MNMEKSEKIVIGMPLKNGAKTIRRAVESVLSQREVRKDLILLIVDDNSTDNWREEIEEYLDNPQIVVVNVDFGNPYAVRNFIIDYVRENMPDARYIGRLDADDHIFNEYAISKIENIIDKHDPDVIIAGNAQMINGQLIRINRADKKFLKAEYLEKRLLQMASGILEGELPSCNVFVKTHINIRYKNIDSAEDHWYLVDLLLNRDKYKIYVAKDLIYSVYNLNGNITVHNKKRYRYLESRKKLYEYFIEKTHGNKR